MPKINYKDYQKQEENSESREFTVSEVQVSDHQYFIKEEGIVFDVIDLDFDGRGPGMEILMSFVGEDFKMRCDMIPKEIFDTLDIPDYLIHLLDENKHCLECKTKFLDGLCNDEGGENEGEEDIDEKA